MELSVGAVLEGKVKSITNYGAFISLPENMTGLVHISEVSNTYVSDVRAHLTEGQQVRVMVLGNEDGKLRLSIKRLLPREQRPNPRRDGKSAERNAPRESEAAPKTADQLFEEKLKKFMAESDSNLSSVRRYEQPRPRRKK